MRRVRYPQLFSLPAVLLLALPAVLPLLSAGLSVSYDGRTHVLRLGALQRAVADGVFLPQWIGGMQLGHGYPLFLFYPIGGYYLALLPALAGLQLDYAFNLGLAAAVLIAAV